MPIQWGVGLLQIVPLIGAVDPYPIYALALWWLVFAGALQFIIQIAAASRTEISQD
jgi:hypothetical protein